MELAIQKLQMSIRSIESGMIVPSYQKERLKSYKKAIAALIMIKHSKTPFIEAEKVEIIKHEDNTPNYF